MTCIVMRPCDRYHLCCCLLTEVMNQMHILLSMACICKHGLLMETFNAVHMLVHKSFLQRFRCCRNLVMRLSMTP